MTKGGVLLKKLKEELLGKVDEEIDDVSTIINNIDELLHNKKHPNNE